MRQTHLFVAIALLFGAANALAGDFQLTGLSLQANGTLPVRHVLNGFGCSGENISPQLSWQGGTGRDEELCADRL